MSSDRYAQIKGLFAAACELPAQERRAFLDAACGSDLELRREVESLLTFHQTSESEEPAFATPLPVRFDDAAMPERVGPYRLLRRLGEGGMGAVFEAEQETPVSRKVALKLIKWGMETREVVARFEGERQALALMNHPNIAKVLDAGATEHGRPYFVMELALGMPITEHSDRQRLTTRERLQLFARVCEGVQHAHQKGIIHRDLKPSNVLVTTEEGRPVPKIIDFGVAKATDQRLTEHTVATRLGQWIGTPEYMSPEQAAMSGDDIDTRTDVYSLGVMLYELLVGTVPIESSTQSQSSFDEMRRRIREEDPPRPSTRVSSRGDASRVAAQNRRTEPHALVHSLRGDLDWIAMKALEKDRSRRYDSAAELGGDIERFLHNEPVTARPPSAAYRLGKFVRRNRAAVVATAMVAVALVAGTVAATIGLVRAEREAAAARQASELLIGVFQVMDPTAPFGHSRSIRSLLHRGAERIAGALEKRPAEKARILSAIGQAYVTLGDYDEAQRLLEEALALQRQQHGSQDSALIGSLNSLAWLHGFRAEYQLASRYAEEAAARAEAIYGPGDATTLSCRSSQGWLLWRSGRFAEARALLDTCLALSEKTLGPNDLTTANLLFFRAILSREDGEYREARAALERCLKTRELALGGDHTSVGWALNDLAAILRLLGDSKAARRAAERALAIQERALGPGNMAVAYPLDTLGRLDLAEGNLDSARQRFRRAMAVRENALGPEHPEVAWNLNPLATIAERTDDWTTSLALRRRALALEEAGFGPEHPETMTTMVFLALATFRTGHLEEAKSLGDRAERILLAPERERYRRTTVNIYNLACMRALQGDSDHALDLLERAIDGGLVSEVMFDDPDLDSLRLDPRFERLLKEMKERLARRSR